MTVQNGNNGRIFEFGKFVLDTNERILFADGEPVHLTDKVFDTLHLFVQHNGRLLTKEQMMSSIWEESFVEEGNLAKNISRLRKILNVDEAAVIETIPRRGYRFAADIKELDGDTSLLIRRNLRLKITQTDDVAEKGQEEEGETGRQIKGSVRSRPRVLTAVAAGLLAVVSGLGIFFLKGQDSALQNRDDRGLQSDASVIRLTDDPGHDFWPMWTMDGQIRFYRKTSATDGKNMLMNADGSNQTEVEFKDVETFLHWSPDGKKVIYAKPGDKTARYIANADGSNEIALPPIGNADWSADSKSIVYQLGIGEPNNSELFIYSIESGKTENISNHPGFDADPGFSPDGSQVAFTSTRDGNAEIYLMKADGSDVRRLTNHPAWENHPAFSPDGTTIAFTADRDSESADIYLMNLDGSNIRRMTESKFDETFSAWSPDGTQIAFFSDREGNDDIYVMSAEVFKPQMVLADEQSDLQYPSYSPDGKQIVFQSALPDKSGELRIHDTESKQTRVLTSTENGDLQPAISPDGSQIVFQNKVGSNTEICLINTDGSGFTNITQNPARDAGPSFSPDGKKLAFVTNREGNTAAFYLYTMNVDGSEQRRVFPNFGLILTSSWSPDGREITFVSDNTALGNFEIFSIALDDPANEKQLTHRRRSDSVPSISPDGKRIAFASNSDGNWEIYVMNHDGSGIFRLTRNPGDDSTPRWSPDGNNLIFASNRTGKFALYTIDLSGS